MDIEFTVYELYLNDIPMILHASSYHKLVSNSSSNIQAFDKIDALVLPKSTHLSVNVGKQVITTWKTGSE